MRTAPSPAPSPARLCVPYKPRKASRLDTLRAAHEHSRTLEASVAEQITDDAMAVEAYGEQVHTVTGHTDAFKITTPLDLRIARALYPTAPESAGS